MKRILFIICSLLLVSSLTVNAQDNSAARAYISQANNYLSKGDYRNAKAKAEAALKISPSNSEALRIKATCDKEFKKQEAEKERQRREQERKAEEKRQEAERKRLEAEQQERDAYKAACNSGSESEMRSFISHYPKYRTEMENRIEDLKLWNKAKETATVGAYNQYLSSPGHNYHRDEALREIDYIKNRDKREFDAARATNTEEAYQRYLQNFPDGNYRAEAQERIREIQAWSNARSLNTKTAYQDYLSKSTIKSHLKEANDAIRNIESEEEWARIKDSNYRSDFERFVNNYPASLHRSEADWHINLLKGEEIYNQGMESQSFNEKALSYLMAANNYRRLTGEQAEHLDQLQAKKKYWEMMRSKSESEVQSYLNSLSTTNPYYLPVSDHLARLKADNLTNKSNIKIYRNQAMAFAISRETKQYVKDRYKSAKKLKSYQKKTYSSTSSYSSFDLGEWLSEHAQIGLDTSLELAIGTGESDNYDNLTQLGLGFMGRFGRSIDVLNVFLGVRYWSIVPPEDFIEDDEGQGYISIPLSIRCNLIRTDGHGSFFIGAGAEYGMAVSMREDTDCLETKFFSLSPQIGWTNKHFEISVFYKSYLHGPYKKDWVDYYKTLDRKSLIGINVGYYF